MSKKDFKRQEILDFITQKVTEEGYVPSVREICKAVDLNSPATVHYHINLLAEEGLIIKEPNKKRFIKLAQPIVNNFAKIPVLGRVTAGMPILAVEDIEDYIFVPTTLVRSNEAFGLIVKGESMINAGIRDGDTLIVQKTNVAQNGEIVVAMIEDEATVKRFYKENKQFRLQPENDDFEPIYTNELQILGKVVALYRFMMQ